MTSVALASIDASEPDVLDRLLGMLDTDGGVIVHGMLAPDVLMKLNADLDAAVEGAQPGTRHDDATAAAFWGRATKRFTRLAWRSPTFASDVLVHPILTAVADRLLLPHCADYWMNTGQMMVIGPGERAQYLHRDADNWPRMNDPDGWEVTVSCMFALTDFTAAAGATQVVPGSHRWPDYTTRPTPDEISRAVMPAGSGLIYTGRVIHGGGANTSDGEWRRGLHLSYVLGWLTPEEAGPLGVPDDAAQQLPVRAQRLLGWRSYETASFEAGRLWTVDYEDVPVGLGWEKGRAEA
jgi:ectoine hydroxylase-related dioxygenase (phytanoyl-CoA dioxygenase family)